MEKVEIAVVGGGAMGTAAARALAGRGRAVTLLEKDRIGNSTGSSGGPTRIFRLAYEHPDYVRMARIALDRWRELESEAGQDLMITTGGIDTGPGAVIAAEALAAAGEPFTLPTPSEVRERWPALRIADHEPVLLQEDAGVCMAQRTVLAQARLARGLGADLREGVAVDSVTISTDGAEIRTADETFQAEVVVIAAGSWAGKLLPSVGVNIPLVPTLEQVTYLRLDRPSPLPTVIDWIEGGHASPYAVPDPTEPGAFKIALHLSGPPVDPDTDGREPDPVREATAIAHAAGRFAPHSVQGTETCLYTRTPDEDFVLDRIGPVVIASPCSGHGFKFTPLMGEVIADLATGSTPRVDIGRFAAGRF